MQWLLDAIQTDAGNKLADAGNKLALKALPPAAAANRCKSSLLPSPPAPAIAFTIFAQARPCLAPSAPRPPTICAVSAIHPLSPMFRGGNSYGLDSPFTLFLLSSAPAAPFPSLPRSLILSLRPLHTRDHTRARGAHSLWNVPDGPSALLSLFALNI